jgi:phosphotransferase system enzyme I (PtsI)
MPDPVPEPAPATQEIVNRAAEAMRIGPAMQAVAAELRARAERAEEETKKVLEAISHMAEDFGLRDLAVTGPRGWVCSAPSSCSSPLKPS